MAIPILIIGKSGSGKSYSMKNIPQNDYALINVQGKMLPFRGSKNFVKTFNYNEIKQYLLRYSNLTKTIIVDDAGYLMADALMNKPKEANGFRFFEQLAADFYEFIRYIESLPDDLIVPIFMHEELDEFGGIKVKTVGKMLDNQVDIPGMFTIVLRSVVNKDGHYFETSSDGFTPAKTPEDMFKNKTIPNDLNVVLETVREYYGLNKKIKEENENE